WEIPSKREEPIFVTRTRPRSSPGSEPTMELSPPVAVHAVHKKISDVAGGPHAALTRLQIFAMRRLAPKQVPLQCSRARSSFVEWRMSLSETGPQFSGTCAKPQPSAQWRCSRESLF